MAARLDDEITEETLKSVLGELMVFYELRSPDGREALRFSAATAAGGGAVRFMGEDWTPLPVDSEGFEWKTGSTLPRATLRLSAVGFPLNPRQVAERDDFRGWRATRYRTFSRHLGENERPPMFPRDVFFVDRMERGKDVIELTLASSVEQSAAALPGRRILRSYCTRSYRVWDSGKSAFSYVGVDCPYQNPAFAASYRGGRQASETRAFVGPWTGELTEAQFGASASAPALFARGDLAGAFAAAFADGTRFKAAGSSGNLADFAAASSVADGAALSALVVPGSGSVEPAVATAAQIRDGVRRRRLRFSVFVRRWQAFPYFTDGDEETTDASKDKCSRTEAGCRLRFGDRGTLPARLFPGVLEL